jgi:hypothetical protein
MPLMDKTGRNLRVGQLVDCFLMGRFTGEVVAIEEGSALIGNGPKRPPMVAVSIAVPFPVQRNTCSHVYIVKAAPLSPDSPVEEDGISEEVQ